MSVPLHLPATVTHCLWPSAGITPPASKTLPECRPEASRCQRPSLSARWHECVWQKRKTLQRNGTHHHSSTLGGGALQYDGVTGAGAVYRSMDDCGSFLFKRFLLFFLVWLQDHRSCPVLISPPAVAPDLAVRQREKWREGIKYWGHGCFRHILTCLCLQPGGSYLMLRRSQTQPQQHRFSLCLWVCGCRKDLNRKFY